MSKVNCELCVHFKVCEFAVYTHEIICSCYIAKSSIERPQGKWIDKGLYYECSNCHGGYMRSITEKCHDLVQFNYCPICGSDNRGCML